MLGFAEQLEFLETLNGGELDSFGGCEAARSFMLEAAKATSDFYIESSPCNGIPYWDTAAPGLVYLEDYLERPADPFNEYEPVDSSAGVIAAQGLLRLGNYLKRCGDATSGNRYWQAGLTVFASLLEAPYLSTAEDHQGLILHSLYHRPNGWDHIPQGRVVPCGESSLWGDYHARELALYLKRLILDQPYLTFWGQSETGH
jgi:hypothetical protein